METGWIQVFVLTLAECVAPEGKTVCQEREFELEFLDRAHCERALEQLVDLKSRVDDVIVDAEASRCTPTARQRENWPDRAAINAAHADVGDWREPPAVEETPVDDTREAHRERLARLPACDETGGEPPCKVGQIIVEEEPPEKIEVWRRDDDH